jgi:hypothetical protein
MPRLSLLLLLLVSLARPADAQTLQEKRFGAPAPGDTLPRMITREYELYGPTTEDVRLANDEIRVATSQFGTYMGEHPKKMAFVLLRSADDIARFDPKPLTRRGMQIVLWILGPHGMQQTPAQPGTGANPDPLAHEAGHRFLIAYVEHVLALEGKASGAGAAPDGASSAAAGGSGPGSVSAPHPDVAILPDWVEEAVAGICERPSYQKGRIDFLRAHIDQRIPFAEFLEMRRPGAPAAKSGGAKGAQKTGAVKGAGGAGPDRATIFCDQSVALARFIAHREDERFFGTIVEGVLRGRTVGDVLNTSSNLLSKPEALEKQWLEWMQGEERAP